MFSKEQSNGSFHECSELIGKNIAKHDRHIQTVITIGKDDIKKEMFELLTKRNYKQSKLSQSNEKHASHEMIQTIIPNRNDQRRINVLNRELKEANEEIEEMDGLIKTSWNRLKEEKDKKREAIRRYRISRSASIELEKHYYGLKKELSVFKCKETGWIER